MKQGGTATRVPNDSGNSNIDEGDSNIRDNVTNHLNQLDYVSPTCLSKLGQGISLISVNVRSILANGDKLQDLLDATKPTVAALQETWQTTRDFEGYQGKKRRKLTQVDLEKTRRNRKDIINPVLEPKLYPHTEHLPAKS